MGKAILMSWAGKSLVQLIQTNDGLYVVKIMVTTRCGRQKDDYRRTFLTLAQAEEDFDQMVMCNCI